MEDNYIEKTIADLHRRIEEYGAGMREYAAKIETARQTIDLLGQLLEEAKPPVEVEKVPAETSSPEPVSSPAKLRTSKRGSSKYKGVSKRKVRRDGTFAWKAQYWKGSKVFYLGIFDSEELAAAAVAEHNGDKKEAIWLWKLAAAKREEKSPPPAAKQPTAQALADMAEQMDANPDRPVPSVWQCNKCGRDYDRKRKSCENCKCESFTHFGPHNPMKKPELRK